MLATTLALLAPAPVQELPEAYISVGVIFSDIWRVEDLDGNGDYNGPGELTKVYEGSTTSFRLDRITDLALSPDGTLWLLQGLEPSIVRMRDLNSDGDFMDPGEAADWADLRRSSTTGLQLEDCAGLWLDDDGVLWTSSNRLGASTGRDLVARIEDLDGNGDANGVGEQASFFEFATSGGGGASRPQGVVGGNGRAMYALEAAPAGVLPPGVHRLDDADGSGAIEGAERSLYYDPGVPSSIFQLEWLAVDDFGRIYVEDIDPLPGIVRLTDRNGDGVIAGALEAERIYQSPAPREIWRVEPARDGAVFVVQDDANEPLFRLVDLDGDGLFTLPGERQLLYDRSAASFSFFDILDFEFLESTSPVGVEECTQAVPNSSGETALLEAVGSASLADGDLQLRASALPASSFGYILVSLDAGLAPGFGGGAGTLCLGGTLGGYAGSVWNSGLDRAAVMNVDPAAIPLPSGPTMAAAGETWRFQAWFRDADPMPTSNLSRSLAVPFLP